MNRELEWRRSGVLKSHAELRDQNVLIAELDRGNSLFSHKTKGNWEDTKCVFNYDGSVRDNVLFYDEKGNTIGKYEADLFVEGGTFQLFDQGSRYAFKRVDLPAGYAYHLKLAEALLVELTILKQNASNASGSMCIYEQGLDLSPVLLLAAWHVTIHN